MIDLPDLKDPEHSVTDLWDALHELRAEITRRDVVDNSAALAEAAQAEHTQKLEQISLAFQESRQEGDGWIPPQGAHDVYPQGWETNWSGKRWKSLIPNNVTKPGDPDDPQNYRWWEDLTPAPEPPEGENAYWDGRGVEYELGDKAQDDGINYTCRQAHTSQPDWAPADTPAMWEVVPAEPPAGEGVPVWEQRWADPYWPTGSVVTWKGKTWDNTMGTNNHWEPGVHGWTARP